MKYLALVLLLAGCGAATGPEGPTFKQEDQPKGVTVETSSDGVLYCLQMNIEIYYVEFTPWMRVETTEVPCQ